jgi:serine-aspartate repeat-containing protein C/D/E
MGQIGDRPVTGDWDGDGKTDIGVLGPVWAGDGRALTAEPGLPDVRNLLVGRSKNLPPDPDQAPMAERTMKRSSLGKISADLIDHVFLFGSEGDFPVTGDWDGDGISNVGLFRDGIWFLDADGNGRWSEGDIYVENFGKAGDIPVVGDWTGDGVTKIGVYRQGTFYLDTNNNHVLDAGDKVIRLGGPGDIPVVGDWTGDGIDKVGVYRPNAPKPEQQAADVPEDRPAAASPPATTAAKPDAAPMVK